MAVAAWNITSKSLFLPSLVMPLGNSYWPIFTPLRKCSTTNRPRGWSWSSALAGADHAATRFLGHVHLGDAHGFSSLLHKRGYRVAVPRRNSRRNLGGDFPSRLAASSAAGYVHVDVTDVGDAAAFAAVDRLDAGIDGGQLRGELPRRGGVDDHLARREHRRNHVRALGPAAGGQEVPRLAAVRRRHGRRLDAPRSRRRIPHGVGQAPGLARPARSCRSARPD